MIKKPLVVFLLSTLGLVVLPNTADACDCASGRVLPPAQFGTMDVVFLGRVVRFQPLESVEFEVLETYNGRVDRRVRIVTGRSDCDYFLPPVAPKVGTQFLINGTRHDDGILEANRCLGSGPSNRKTRELEILRRRHGLEPKRVREFDGLASTESQRRRREAHSGVMMTDERLKPSRWTHGMHEGRNEAHP